MNITTPRTVLLTHPQYPQSSGLSNCIFQLAEALSNLGYIVLIVIRIEKHYNILAFPSLTPIYHLIALENIPSTINPDLVVSIAWHTWSYNIHQAFANLSVPCIFWSHGTSISVHYPHYPVLSILRTISKLYHYIYLLRTLLSASCLVVAYKPSTILDSRSTDYFISRLLRKHIVILPNPVDTNLWRPNYNIQNRSTLITQSRLEWQKGFPFILDILKSTDLHDLTYQWISSSPTPSQSDYPLTNMSRIQFFHNISTSSRINLLASSLCYISFSQTEYQSISILEALSCGIPVISTRTGWTKSREIPGILFADDITQVKAHIVSLQQNPSQWTTLSTQARNYVENLHSTSSFSSSWANLVNTFLK